MSKLSIECKKLMIKEISDRLNGADTLVVTNYKGLSAKDLNELRKELRGISGEYLVVKDSMVKKAIAENPVNNIAELIEGEVGIAIDREQEPTYISKILVRFSKANEFLKIRGGMMKGTALSKEDIAVLAALPSRDVLLGKLANVLNAPVQGLASALHGIISKLVYALDRVKENKPEQKAEEIKAPEEKKEEKPVQEQTGEKTEEKKEDVQVEEKKEEAKSEDVKTEPKTEDNNNKEESNGGRKED